MGHPEGGSARPIDRRTFLAGAAGAAAVGLAPAALAQGSKTGVDPAQCLAIEDSRTGAASANAAGCYVIAVPHAVNVPPAPRRSVIPSLGDVTAADLAEFAGFAD